MDNPGAGARILHFYPRPLRGGRLAHRVRVTLSMEFLSTPSARRATVLVISDVSQVLDFYPRPLRGGRPFGISRSTTWQRISIHALCEEGDDCFTMYLPSHGHFYPRPLRGGRLPLATWLTLNTYFYPRPLRGGRLITVSMSHRPLVISIHALCEEGDHSPSVENSVSH